MHRTLLTVATALALVVPVLAAAPATAQSRFSDADGTIHADAIEALAQVGVVGGYPDGTYRPRQAVSRDQMGTFLMRALQLSESRHSFEDVAADSTHSGAIGAIAAEDVTRGCAPRRYCPREEVTRAQMATFLDRALDLPDDDGSSFADVDPDDVHAPGIRAVAAAGITMGCGDGTRYCPADPVRRDQMAAFLDRALGLDGPVPCRDLTGPATASTIGPAVYGFGVSAGVRTGDRLELLSMDLQESRAARVPADDGSTAITGTATVPKGTRTWATAAGNGHVFVGQDVDDANLYRLPSSDTLDRPATEVARVPYGGEFWALALDEDRDRLWAGTRGHREEELEDDEHVVYRVDGVSDRPGDPEAVTFSHDDMPRQGGTRPDVKQLHWDAGTQRLLVGLGGSATFPGAARLYALDLSGQDDETGVLDDTDTGPPVEDLTPPGLDDELEIFSLSVTDTHLAVGTRSETSAHVAFRERDGGEWTVDRLPDGERRVDQVAVGDDRLVAATFPSGTVYEYDLRSGARTTLGSAHGAADQPTRFLEVDGEVVRGVTSQGVVWTRTDSWSSVPFTNRSGATRLTAPGLAHSLALTSRHVVAGANNSVHARSLTTPSSRTVTAVGGEAKALAVHGSTVWAATYPGAALWRVEPGEGIATHVGSWDGRYQRPRDAAFSTHRSRVLVVARSDPGTWSGLFQLNPDRQGSEGVRVTDGERRNVQATAVATHRDLAFVGTHGAGVPGEGGGVVAYDLRDMSRAWYARPARGRVVSLEMVGERLVGVAQTNSLGGGNTWFELDPRSGRLLAAGSDDTRLGRGPIGDAVSLGPVTIGAMGGDVASIQRGADRATGLYRHAEHETFHGPFVDAERRGGWCTVYAIEGREIFRLPYDPATRLDD